MARGRLSGLGGDKLDLEVVGVGEVGGVVLGSAGVRMPFGEQQRPAVGRAVRGELVDALPRAGVEREMVQPGPEPVVLAGGQSR